MKFRWANYPRFRVQQVSKDVPSLFKWQVVFYSWSEDEGTLVYQSSSAQFCWDFVNEWPRPKNRVLNW